MDINDKLLLEIIAMISTPIVLLVLSGFFLLIDFRQKVFAFSVIFLSSIGLQGLLYPIALEIFGRADKSEMIPSGANFSALGATAIGVVVLGVVMLFWSRSIVRAEGERIRSQSQRTNVG